MQLKINRNITPSILEQSAQINIVSPHHNSHLQTQIPTTVHRARPIQTTIVDHIIIDNETEAQAKTYSLKVTN